MKINLKLLSKFLLSPFFVGTLCVLLLGIDIVPGKVVTLLLESNGWVLGSVAIVIIGLIILSIGWFAWTVVQLTRRKVRFWTKQVYLPLISMLMAIVTCVALTFHIPTKLGFLVSYPQFQRAIVPGAVQAGSRVGLFRVEDVTYPSKRWKEGIHFNLSQTQSAGSFTYGISYRPNLQKSEMPYGLILDKGYDRIWGNWYIFQAAEC